jgi:Pacifastin inhibitor (LCMII)
MKRLLPLFPLTALLLVTMGIGNCDSQPLGRVDGGPGCTNQCRARNTTFASCDGCNTCTCDALGKVACTLIGCTPGDGGQPTTDGGVDMTQLCVDPVTGNLVACTIDAGVDGPKGCAYGGKVYSPGTSFPPDACNSCFCAEGGTVSCTHRACPDGGPLPDGGFADGGAKGSCTVGSDQTCNEDPTISSLRGKCLPDASCACSGPVSAYTGRCLGVGNKGDGNACEYGGVVQPLGSTFPCSDGCNKCTCLGPGQIIMTEIACNADSGTAMCGLDAIYLYGDVGGLVSARDQVTLAPDGVSSSISATYVYNRTPVSGSSGVSCSPALPACQDPSKIDVADVMADISDSIVQKYLATKSSPPMLFGFDPRPSDGTIFSFQRGDGHGFLVGSPCTATAGCVSIPDPIARLVGDLRSLDRQQLSSPSCAALLP